MQEQGKFTLIKEIGKGRYGAVYEAEDEGGQHWAAKCFPFPLLNAEKIDQELSVLQKVRSPYVVQVLASLSSSRNHYLVQELCSGGSLKSYLTKHGPMPEPHLKRLLRQVALGLLALKQKEVLHLDLRPSNLLLTGTELTEFSVKIADFGLSRVLERIVVPAYSSPEVLEGGLCSFPADIWSFATTAYELATGELLFPSPEVQQHSPIALQGLPIPLRELLSQALTLDPQQRPSIENILANAYFAGLPEDSSFPTLPPLHVSRQYDSIPRGTNRKLFPIESVIFLEDDYLILDYEEESHSQELQAANSLCSTLFSQLSIIEDIEVKSLDKSALCYCKFATRLQQAVQQLYSYYSHLEMAQEFDQFRALWANATAIVLKLQTKLLSLEGALPMFLDEKVIKVTLLGENLVATKTELEEEHMQSLALITRLADDLTRHLAG